MEEYPLFVRFTHPPIVGRDFVAGVRVEGRAVATKNDGEWWIDGVDIGQVAEGGATLREAADAFRDRITGVLFDLAGEAGSYAEFEREVLAFLSVIDREDERRWTFARTAAQPRADDVSVILGIRRDASDRPSSVLVVRLHPADVPAMLPNRLDEVTLAPAA